MRVRVRWDTGQLHFAALPAAGRARHAFVPRWHFDMVLDEQARLWTTALHHLHVLAAVRTVSERSWRPAEPVR